MASAQQKKAWTLRECIDYALENNITVKQQDVKRRQGEIDLSTAKNSRLPDLSASASQNWSFGRGLTSDNTYSNQNTGSTSFSLGTSVPLFTGACRWRRHTCRYFTAWSCATWRSAR